VVKRGAVGQKIDLAGTSLQNCNSIFAFLAHEQRENIEQIHVRDVLIMVQVWRLVPAAAKSSTASAVAKPFAAEMTPDDRGYSKFNRFRGSCSQNSG
jgi:hypothetical protein